MATQTQAPQTATTKSGSQADTKQTVTFTPNINTISSAGGGSGTGTPKSNPPTPNRTATSASPLTRALATARFAVTATPKGGKGKKAPARAPEGTKQTIGRFRATTKTNRTVPVTKSQYTNTTRIQQLRRITSMKNPSGKGTAGGAIPGSGPETPQGIPITPNGKHGALASAFGEPGRTTAPRNKALTAKLADVVTTIGRHVLDDKKFTAENTELTQAQWTKIQDSAKTRLDEREKNEPGSTVAASAANEQTTTVTGQQLYDDFVKSYSSKTTVKTGQTTVSVKEYWDRKFVQMGLTSTYTPSKSEAEDAYKQVLTQAKDGNETATTAIKQQIANNATTFQTAKAQVGTGFSGQSLSDYYLQYFTTIAHEYLVPQSQAALNQRAALAATQTTTTNGSAYEARENEIADYTETMQRMAAQLYPTFATQITKGVPTQTLLDPYSETIGKTLGFNTATKTATQGLGITWQQPKWSVFLTGGKSQTGKLPAPMTLDQVRQTVITTPQYGWATTDTGKQAKANVAQQLAQSFGLRKA